MRPDAPPSRSLGCAVPGALALVLVACTAIALLAAPAVARHAGAIPGGLARRLAAGPPVVYEVALPAPQTQMVEFAIIVPATGLEDVTLVLPTWRPGRYEILDPSGTVRETSATGADGRDLEVTKTTKNRWRVSGTGGASFRFAYRVYANSIRDRTRHADDTHAFLNPSSCFVFVPELRARPIEVRLDMPEDWRVGTGLGIDSEDPRRLYARDYDVLADSPIEVGRHDVVRFDAAGAAHEIVIWPPDLDYDAERLRRDFAAIVEASVDVFGPVPYERYVFLLHVGAGGGGTEHLNSTIMQTSRAAIEGSHDGAEDSSSYRGLLGLTAHEFVHTWNVKQFRPAGLKPYDYERENYTPLLWVAEGTTSYYDELLPVRAGLWGVDRLVDRLEGAIRSHRSLPGARVQSLEQSSFDAWVKFNVRSPDDVNCEISFYSKGWIVSALLDLEIRRRTDGTVTLDDVMAELYRRFPYDARGYTTGDLREIIETLTGSDFGAFLARFVAGTDRLDFEGVLPSIGLELVLEPEAGADDAEDADGSAGLEQRAYLGLDLRSEDGRTVVRAVRSDGPAYEAGLHAGDEIVALDGRRLGAGELDDRLERRAPGETVRITWFRRDGLRTSDIVLGARPRARWTIRPREDASESEIAAFEAWTGAEWPYARPAAADDDGGTAIASDDP